MLNTEQHFRFRIFKRFPLAESERKRERGRWDCFPLEGRGISRGKLARVAKGKWVIPRFVFPRDKSGRGVATKSWRESRAHLSRALTAYERWYGDEIRDTDLSSWQFRTVELSSLLAAQHRRTNWPLEKLRVRVAYMINRTFPPFATRPSFQGLKLFPLPWFPWRGIIFQMGRCVCVWVCAKYFRKRRSRESFITRNSIGGGVRIFDCWKWGNERIDICDWIFERRVMYDGSSFIRSAPTS